MANAAAGVSRLAEREHRTAVEHDGFAGAGRESAADGVLDGAGDEVGLPERLQLDSADEAAGHAEAIPDEVREVSPVFDREKLIQRGGIFLHTLLHRPSLDGASEPPSHLFR